MAKEACRACDGKGERTVEDRENCMKSITRVCSRCNGAKKEPGPPKGDGKRFFRRTPKSEDDGNDLDRAADLFLAKHGFGKNGR